MKLAPLLMFVASPALAELPAFERSASVAFLGLTFIDSSTEGAYNGVREDETLREAMVEDWIRAQLGEAGMQVLDIAPVAEQIENTKNPARCYGCEITIGAKLGADYVLVGEVQKVSNLILTMNLVLREVESREVVRALSVDFRSNTDETWLRAARYILRNHIFRE